MMMKIALLLKTAWFSELFLQTTRLHGVTTWKTAIWISAAIRPLPYRILNDFRLKQKK
jgi:hypothetical protein